MPNAPNIPPAGSVEQMGDDPLAPDIPPAGAIAEDGDVYLGSRLEPLFSDPAEPVTVTTQEQALFPKEADSLERGASRMQFVLLPLLAGGAAAGLAAQSLESPVAIGAIGVGVAGLTLAVGLAASP